MAVGQKNIFFFNAQIQYLADCKCLKLYIEIIVLVISLLNNLETVREPTLGKQDLRNYTDGVLKSLYFNIQFGGRLQIFAAPFKNLRKLQRMWHRVI